MATRAKKAAPKSKKHAAAEKDEPRTNRRAIWSGSISFGLLQIPVSLVTAEKREDEIHFRQLHKKDLTPIRYERVSSTSGKAVEWGDIVKGYEYEKGQFVVLEDEDLKKANVKATQTIDIQDFVDASGIDSLFFETPYYLVPQKRAAKAYVLLRKALEKKKAVAIATFVLRTREHLCAVQPMGDALVLEVLRFGHELRGPDEVALPKAAEVTLAAREVEMAEKLIEGMKTDWDPAKYKDSFHADVKKMIAEKVETGKVTARKKPEGKRATDVVDLLELLKASVAKHGKRKSANDDAPAKKKTTRSRKSKAA